jgi:hypothetical protein
MIFDCIKLNLFEYNVLWVVSVRKNMNFNFQPLFTFVYFFAKTSYRTKTELRFGVRSVLNEADFSKLTRTHSLLA